MPLHLFAQDRASILKAMNQAVASGIRCKRDGRGSGFMVMLGDGTDILRAVGGLAGRYRAWPELGGWFEQ